MSFLSSLGHLISPVLKLVPGVGEMASAGLGMIEGASKKKDTEEENAATRADKLADAEWARQNSLVDYDRTRADSLADAAKSRSDYLSDQDRQRQLALSDDQRIHDRSLVDDQAVFDRAAAEEQSIYDRTRSDGLSDASLQFSRLRDAATSAGFNPLTALGASAPVPFSGGSSGAFAPASGVVGGGGVDPAASAVFGPSPSSIASFTRDSGLPPLSTVGMLSDAVTKALSGFTPEAAAAREQVGLQSDLLKLKIDQARSGVSVGPAKLSVTGPLDHSNRTVHVFDSTGYDRYITPSMAHAVGLHDGDTMTSAVEAEAFGGLHGLAVDASSLPLSMWDWTKDMLGFGKGTSGSVSGVKPPKLSIDIPGAKTNRVGGWGFDSM
uniref:Uncharacterized protein n=1 Tax=uncultured prokaryote TaxID=198431 RepID=A0A0H5Q754_9ZZZZ|nr:hypothetical protein [uncultured prokaryote]